MPFSLLHLPCFMGIVNVTPDSFSDGAQFLDARAAEAHARGLLHAGAQILDLGAEASSFFRKEVEPTPPAVQIQRLLPVLERLRDLPPEVLLSIDTRSAEVARAALAFPRVRIINDISAGTHDPALLDVVAASGAGIILMHMSPGYPATPAADDTDILRTVRDALAQRIAAAGRAGISRDHIALDPGVGFGKTMADNWRLAACALEIRPAGFTGPVVLGVSRKRFLETAPPADLALALPAPTSNDGPHPRDPATWALTRHALAAGVAIHRVHHVSAECGSRGSHAG